MEKKIKKTSWLILLGLISCNLMGQQISMSQDSLLNFLKSDLKLSVREKSAYADTLFQMYSSEEFPCKWIETALLKSKYETVLGNIEEALFFVNKANTVFVRSGCNDCSILPQIYLCYSKIYLSQNELWKANRYAQKGIYSWDENCKNEDILVQLYATKGSAVAEPDSQLLYTQKSYDVAAKISDLELMGMALNDIGCIYANLEENDQAIEYFKKAMSVAVQRKAYNLMSTLYNNMAGLSSDPKQVQLYLDSAIYFARLKGNLEDLQTAYQNSAFFNYEKASYQTAFDMLMESNEVKDSLYNRDKIAAFAEMEQKYESVKKEAQISLLNEQKQNRTHQRNVLFVGAILLMVFSYSLIRQRDKVKREMKRSDELLLNILPSEVAEELKQTGEAVAKQYNHVTVLFTDFVNFTGISQQMSPKGLVEEIHRNFTAFDAIMEKNGLEKIKTIGDAYLAVCGLPNESADHAQRVVKAAIDIQEYMLEHGGKFKIRIGINSGPVVAGIVGVKKYAYDIWGDTVNMAARMEQNSEAGKINMSGATYELVKNDFKCIYRGKIGAKNKGEVDMYFVA